MFQGDLYEKNIKNNWNFVNNTNNYWNRRISFYIIQKNMDRTINEIEIGTKQYINPSKEIKIKGTDDTIMITKKLKMNLQKQLMALLCQILIIGW